MQVEVHVFGSLKESVSADVWQQELCAGADLSALLDYIRQSQGEPAFLALTGDNVKIAVNQTLTVAATLHDGDEVAFLPPVTGG